MCDWIKIEGNVRRRFFFYKINSYCDIFLTAKLFTWIVLSRLNKYNVQIKKKTVFVADIQQLTIWRSQTFIKQRKQTWNISSCLNFVDYKKTMTEEKQNYWSWKTLTHLKEDTFKMIKNRGYLQNTRSNMIIESLLYTILFLRKQPL